MKTPHGAVFSGSTTCPTRVNPDNLGDVAFDVLFSRDNLFSVLLAVAGMGGNFLFPEVFLTFSAVIPHDSVEVHIHAADKRKKEE